MQALDPGLLQMGERDADEARPHVDVQRARRADSGLSEPSGSRSNIRSGLPWSRRESFFAIPLRPDVYRAQTAGRLSIQLKVKQRARDARFSVREQGVSDADARANARSR